MHILPLVSIPDFSIPASSTSAFSASTSRCRRWWERNLFRRDEHGRRGTTRTRDSTTCWMTLQQQHTHHEWLQIRSTATPHDETIDYQWCDQLTARIIALNVSQHLRKHRQWDSSFKSKSNQKRIYIVPYIPRIQRRLADGLSGVGAMIQISF